jgi:hypothetical protein
VHVAKAAGPSVRLMMENAFPGDHTYPAASRLAVGVYSKPWNAKEAGDDFLKFEALSAHAGASIEELLAPDANLFTWLREPEDRIISAFFFFVVQERQKANAPFIARLDAGERVEVVFLDWLMQPGAEFYSQQSQLVYGNASNRQLWCDTHASVSVGNAAVEALRRLFFIGLMEDHERSLDAFCAITSTLPPASIHRRNQGRSRPKRIDFTPDEQVRFDEILAPDRAFYALARDVYNQQMANLRRRTEPAFASIGNRPALRQQILREAADRVPVLTTWKAWDPILGENLDTREQLSDLGTSRWRWTGNSPDTFLYFRLPRRTAFELRIHLAPATPPGHAEQTTLKLSGEPLHIVLAITPEGRAELMAMIPQSLANRLPELAELHIHTSHMLDERTLVPYAGTRKLGLAIEAISATPVPQLTLLKRRIGETRVAGLTRRLLSSDPRS